MDQLWLVPNSYVMYAVAMHMICGLWWDLLLVLGFFCYSLLVTLAAVITVWYPIIHSLIYANWRIICVALISTL